MIDKGNWKSIAETRLVEIHRLRKALSALINNVTCLCAEGPDIMRPQNIYDELIKDARDAREVLYE